MLRSAKNGKTMLAVLCGKRKGTSASIITKIPKASSPDKKSDSDNPLDCSTGAFSARNLAGVGQIEVHVLESPKIDELKQAIESLEPDIVYFQGESVAETDDIGPLEVADGHIFSPEGIVALFGDIVPELVYLEAVAASKLGDALQSKGVPYVIFWKGQVTFPCAAHFRHALLAVLGSCSSHVWSAFQLAFASFKFHFGSFKVQGISENASKNVRICPVILGEPPPKSLEPPKPKDSADNDGLPANLAKVQIYDEDLDLPLLVFAESHGQEGAADYGMLEDGLNTLLTVEVKGMRFLHRVSASPPPSSAPTLVRGVVTMRCDLCSSSSARISLLISGSAQTCFDEQMLEYSIKKQLLERGKLVSLLSKSGDTSVADMRKSASIACGALVREVKFRCSSWAVQVLRQLAPDLSFRSLVALGIAGVQGFPVAAFQKEDTDRFRALKVKKQELVPSYNSVQIPSWLTPPPPTVKRQKIQSIGISSKNLGKDIASPQLSKNQSLSPVNLVAAMRPVPHVHSNRDMPFAGSVVAGAHSAWTMKVSVPNSVGGKLVRPNASTSAVAPSASPSLPVSHSRQNVRAPSPAQVFSLNTVSMKKHGCSRPPMQECSEEEFRKDVMQFLISRGHGRLVPSSDLEAFPDAVLNGKKLDLYNLYKEVVSRGGFHVGNGINWKGQVFSKMSNHTLINKMTGVGNTLKKHYETYLLEYELAHDDVDGECCILCHSSAAGDWVNCGICGEWAHLGCDKRSGLGAFKEYAKTDGLEYICPRCSASNARSGSGKKRFRSTANGAS